MPPYDSKPQVSPISKKHKASKPFGGMLTTLCILLLTLENAHTQDLANINKAGFIVKQSKISFDGATIVFMANYDGNFRPYISQLSDSTWGEPELIFSSVIDSLYTITYPQLNFNNKILYFSASKGAEDYDLYSSQLINGEWGNPEPAFVHVNSPADEQCPAVSPDGKKMLFTRPLPDNKPGDYCQGIFITEKDERSGKWSVPVKLPDEFNLSCEMAPFFSADNKTFYFSSEADVSNEEGKKISKKKFNIYWAKIDALTKHYPKSIMPLVNPDEDQLSASVDYKGNIYYSQGDVFRSNERKRYSSISKNVLPDDFLPEPTTLLQGTITGDNHGPIKAKITVSDPFASTIVQSMMSEQNGHYQCVVPQGEYSVAVTKKNHSLQTKVADTRNKREITTDFSLFSEAQFTFNIYDNEYFFPLKATVTLLDSSYSVISSIDVNPDTDKPQVLQVPLGKELNLIVESENYFSDSLAIPFDKEVVFSDFVFDIDLGRKFKSMDFSFTDAETGGSLGLTVTVFNITRNEKVVREVKDGKLVLNMRDGEVYEVSTSAQGYSYFSSEYDMSDATNDGAYVDARLRSLADNSIVLNNITFEYNSYSLNSDSYKELNKLTRYLTENETYKVQIDAHTDDSGTEEYNIKLSMLRAQEVIDFLQDHGIFKERLIAVGFGESKPLLPNTTNENRTKNRRVEFKILEDES